MQETKIVHETWERNGIQYEAWTRKPIDLTAERKAQMAQNMQDHYMATVGHKLALKNDEMPVTAWVPRDWGADR